MHRFGGLSIGHRSVALLARLASAGGLFTVSFSDAFVWKGTCPSTHYIILGCDVPSSRAGLRARVPSIDPRQAHVQAR